MNLSRIKRAFVHLDDLFVYILYISGIARIIPDKFYLRLVYRIKCGRRLNLSQPIRFTEKLQWLKIYNRKPGYSQLADKYDVKDFVKKTIGSKYVIPTLGVWDSPDDIDWTKLPDKFVLKTTHGGGGGGICICKDKSSFDIKEARKKLLRSMSQEIYVYYREYPYANVRKRIIAEELIEDPSHNGDNLIDYKFYCFNGVPEYCQVIGDRTITKTIDFYDMQWQHMPFIGLTPGSKHASTLMPKPSKLEEMQDVARTLSKGIPFSRIDMYLVSNRIYFGEITFFPGGGFGIFDPDSWDLQLGNKIKIGL